MKKTIIGYCLSTIGTLGDLGGMLSIGNNLVSRWSTPPGRFITTVVAIGMDAPFIISTCILALVRGKYFIKCYFDVTFSCVYH